MLTIINKSKFILLFFISQFIIPIWAAEVRIEEVDETIEKINTSKFQNITKMPFKIGFEFQEANSLCPWALDDYNIQKKTLFKISNKNRKLWKVVIDSNDIEFVTEPFSYLEEQELKECLNSIVTSFNLLKKLLENQESVSFENWVNKIKKIAKAKNFTLRSSKNYESVKVKLITRPSNWEPKFAPQVTIQHPLEHSINLYFGLFGFKNAQYMMPFVASLPFKDFYRKFHEDGDSDSFKQLLIGYRSKIAGLVFLHALTLFQMIPNEDDTDSQMINETLNNFVQSYQIDAKMKLAIMSRRPFSAMFKDLKQQNEYFKLFKDMMGSNSDFLQLFKVPQLLYKANYAEQFFDEMTGKPKNLIKFLEYLKEGFVDNNEEKLIELLQQGIVSTTMIRNLKKTDANKEFLDIFNSYNNYFGEMLKSVEHPEKRYILDLSDLEVKSKLFNHDALSPPWLLKEDNSMGAFNKDMSNKEREYGEAIVEIRAIRSVEEWFLKKAKLPLEVKGKFLVRPDSSLIQHSLALFHFLEAFSTKKYLKDIQLGLTYAIFKN